MQYDTHGPSDSDGERVWTGSLPAQIHDLAEPGEAPCECMRYILRNLEYGKIHTPDHSVTTYMDIDRFGWVAYEFTDREDELAQWTYIVPYCFPQALVMDRNVTS